MTANESMRQNVVAIGRHDFLGDLSGLRGLLRNIVVAAGRLRFIDPISHFPSTRPHAWYPNNSQVDLRVCPLLCR